MSFCGSATGLRIVVQAHFGQGDEHLSDVFLEVLMMTKVVKSGASENDRCKTHATVKLYVALFV